jgi:hypothetical protein
MWENSDTGFPYTIGATGILIAAMGDFYVATTRHNIKGRQIDDLLVPYEESGREFLPFEAAFGAAIIPDEEDTDYKDFILLKVARSLVAPETLVTPQWFDLHFGRHVPDLLPNDELCVAGFPKSIQSIEYDESHIRKQRLIADGIHIGQAESAHCNTIRFHDLTMVPDAAISEEPLSGLSGSPVFVMRPTSGSVVPYLAGMMLRATKSSSTGRFIHSYVLYRTLESIRAGKSVPAFVIT